jgi:hypothetical protein
MSKTPSLFAPNGDGYDIQPAGVLLILADTVYNNPQDSSPTGRVRAKNMIDAILTAARAGGFKQGDILATLLATSEVTHRLKDMAVAACDAAGPDAIGQIFTSMRNKD